MSSNVMGDSGCYIDASIPKVIQPGASFSSCVAAPSRTEVAATSMPSGGRTMPCRPPVWCSPLQAAAVFFWLGAAAGTSR